MSFFTLETLVAQRLSDLNHTADVEAVRRSVAPLIRADRPRRMAPNVRRAIGIKLVQAGCRLINGHDAPVLLRQNNELC